MLDDARGRIGHPVRQTLRDVLREALISGLAVVVPIVITVGVIVFVLDTIYNFLDLFSDYLTRLPIITIVPGVVNVSTETLIELAIPVVLLVSILWVGLIVNSSRYGERAVDHFDYVVGQIPGVGSIYESFRQMSDVMLESDVQSFREVKLVEFPHEDAYTLGFVTTETPEALCTPTGHEEMLTLFLPLAPNPVMGGHLIHLPPEKVIDIDLTVDEGIRAIVTSGVAIGEVGDADDGLSPDALRALSLTDRAGQRVDPNRSSTDVRRTSPETTDPRAERSENDESTGGTDADEAPDR